MRRIGRLILDFFVFVAFVVGLFFDNSREEKHENADYEDWLRG